MCYHELQAVGHSLLPLMRYVLLFADLLNLRLRLFREGFLPFNHMSIMHLIAASWTVIRHAS